MNRRHALMLAGLMVLALLMGTRARAASPFDVIPQDSLAFVLVNHMAETDAKIQILLQQVEAPPMSLLNMAKMTLGIREGIDEDGTLVFAVVAPAEEGGAPSPVMLVPVADYQKILEQLGVEDATEKIVEVRVAGERSLIAEHNGYVVAVQPSDRALLEKILAGPKGPSAEVAPLVKGIDEVDVAFVVTRRGVETFLKVAIAGMQQVKEELAEMPDMPEEMRESMDAAVAVFDVYEQILDMAGKELNTFAAGLVIDDDGNLHFTERCRVVSDGEMAKAFNAIKPPSYDLLTGLPSGDFVVVGAGVLPESLVGLLFDFSADMMKAMPELYGMDAEQIDQLMEVSTQAMKGLEGMSMVMYAGEPGDPIYSNIAAVERVADAKKFIADYRNSLSAMDELAEGNESPVLGKMEFEDVTIGGVAACKVSMEMPSMAELATAPGGPDVDQVMEMMIGPGGKITMYFAAADDRTVVLAYTEESLVQACLDVVAGKKPGLAADESLVKTAALLPKDAQWIGYLSPKGLVDFMVRMVDTVAPEATGGVQIPPFPETPPIGFAAKTMPDGVMSHAVIPADVVKGIGEYVAEVQQTMMDIAEPAE